MFIYELRDLEELICDTLFTDHCMGLRENSGGDKDLFSVERRLKRQERKMKQLRERQYEREKRRERNNIFNFINSTIGDKSKFCSK